MPSHIERTGPLETDAPEFHKLLLPAQIFIIASISDGKVIESFTAAHCNPNDFNTQIVQITDPTTIQKISAAGEDDKLDMKIGRVLSTLANGESANIDMFQDPEPSASEAETDTEPEAQTQAEANPEARIFIGTYTITHYFTGESGTPSRTGQAVESSLL